MLTPTNMEIVRRLREPPVPAGVPAETRGYARWEYNGDEESFLHEPAREARSASAEEARGSDAVVPAAAGLGVRLREALRRVLRAVRA